MPKIYYTLLTDRGKELAIAAAASSAKVNLTHFAVGDGGGAYYAPTGQETSLKHETYRVPVSRLVVKGDNITVEAIIPAAASGFVVREIGVFEAGGEMVGIGNFPDVPKEAIEDGVSQDLHVSMMIFVRNSDTFTVNVNPSTQYVTIPMMEELADKKQDKQDARLNTGDGDIVNAINFAMSLATEALPMANFNPDEILSRLSMIPAQGSGLDADLLDGREGADFLFREELGVSIAELDSDGHVLSSQLPSYVDDVREYDTYENFPATGEGGKIYIARFNSVDGVHKANITYRWSGSAYVEISQSVALGEVVGTAYPGDKGALLAAYIAGLKDGSQAPKKAGDADTVDGQHAAAFATAAQGTNSTNHIASKANPHGVTKSQVGLNKVNNNTISMSLSGTTLTINYS